MGCGGNDEAAYAGRVEAFCGEIRGSLRVFERQAAAVAARGDGEAATRAFGGALAALAGDVRRATASLREADPPARYAGFDAAAVRSFDQAAGRLDAVAAAARTGDVDALRDIDRRLGGLDAPPAPPGLRAATRDCRG